MQFACRGILELGNHQGNDPIKRWRIVTTASVEPGQNLDTQATKVVLFLLGTEKKKFRAEKFHTKRGSFLFLKVVNQAIVVQAPPKTIECCRI
jgi:hypothetical protein